MDYSKQAESILPYLIRQESGGNPNAVSPKGAFGLGQTMPSTARDPGYGVTPMRDNSPQEQRRIARDYLAAMLNKYSGDSRLALAAYNAGPGNVDKYHGVPPFKETRNYVSRILGAMGVGSAEAADSPRNYPGEGLQGGDPASFGAVPVDEPQGGDPADFGAVPVDDGPAPLSPEVQTGIRSTVRGLSSPASFLIDIGNAPYNLAARGVNAIRPSTMDYLPMGKDYVDYSLQSMGVNPEAQSGAERAVTSGLSAVTGAGMAKTLGGAVEAAPSLANYLKSAATAPGTQAVSAASASAAGDMAKESGAGPWGQVVASVVAGMATGTFGPKIAAMAAGGIPRSGMRAMQILASGEGDTATAARSLRALFGDEAANQIIKRFDDFKQRGMVELVPGSQPTLAEIGGSDRASIAQRMVLERTGGWPVGPNNQARLDYLKQHFGDETDLANAQKKIESIPGDYFKQLRDAGVDPNTVPVSPNRFTSELAKIKADPNLYNPANPKVKQFIDTLETMAAEQSGWTGWNVLRKNIDGGIDWGAFVDSAHEIPAETKRQMTQLGMRLAGALRTDLKKALPGSEEYFRELSTAIKEKKGMELGQEITGKARNARIASPTDDGEIVGERVLSQAKMGQALDNPRNKANIGRNMDDGQKRALESVRKDLDRENMAFTGGKAEGSPTFQKIEMGKRLDNLVAEDILGGVLGDKSIGAGRATLASIIGSKVGGPALGAILGGMSGGPIAGAAGAAMGAALNAKQERILQLIRQGLLDPEKGVELLRTAKLYNGPPTAEPASASLAAYLAASKDFEDRNLRR